MSKLSKLSISTIESCLWSSVNDKNFLAGKMSSGNKKGRPGPSGSSKSELKSSKPDKKPFDKKKWRENKYSNTLKGKKIVQPKNFCFQM